MKNLLNLKGLLKSNQSVVNPDGHPTADRQSRLTSVLSCLFLLLTLGTGQMWGNTWMEEPKITINSVEKAASSVTDDHWGIQNSMVVTNFQWYAKRDNKDTDGMWAEGKLHYQVTGPTATSWTDIVESSGSWYDDYKTNYINHDMTLDLCDGRSPGDYEFIFCFAHRTGNDSYVWYNNSESNYHIFWTIPGFTGLSTTSVTFDNTTVGSNSSKSITYTHYGTAPTNIAARYSITGTDAAQFSITELSGTGATIKFSPTSAGTKTATLVIKDVHGKQTSEITLTGKTQYTVSYNKGSNGTGTNTTANKVYGENLTLLGATFTRTGYTQTAWNTNAAGTGGTSYALSGSYTSEADVTLYPTWTPKTYTITLDKNGGDSDGNATATYNSSTLTSVSHAARAGYSLNGYFTERSGGTQIINADGTLIANISGYTDVSGNWIFDGDKTLFAQWTESAVYYTVTFSVGTSYTSYGSLSATNNSTSSTISSGAPLVSGTGVTFTATPNTGYEVEGWYTNAECTEGKHNAGSTTYTTSISAATSVYVKFTPISYTLSYELAGGAVASANPTSYTIESSAITLNNPTKEGYTFSGWTGTGLASATTTVTIATGSTGDRSYTATWTGYSYTVRFNANGGSGTMSDETGFVYGTNKALTANAFTRPGYTFSGWATSADGEKVYDDSQNVSILPVSNGATIDLYAVWTERPAVKVYFAKPADWDNVYAFVWKDGGTSNASWPGKQLNASVAGTGTEVINCATYYYYKYYTDDGSADGEGEVGNSAWDKVIFNNGDDPGVANNTKTSDLTLTNGNAYGVHTGMQSTSASGYSTSAKWTLRGSFNSWSGETYPFSCAADGHSSSVLVEGLTASTTYSFKIWGPDGVAYKYTGGKDASYNYDYSVSALLDGTELVLNEYALNNNTFTAVATSYRFTLDVSDPKHPVLTIVPGNDQDFSVSIRTDGTNGASVGSISTVHQYAPTTITATVPEGYHFAGWTHDGSHGITFSNASNATTTVTATSAGGTITANFTTDGFIYLDKSAIKNNWSGDVWVYFYRAAYWDTSDKKLGSGSKTTDGATCITSPKRMTRIGDSQIYYYDYTQDETINSQIKQYIAFTDKEEGGWPNFGACSAIYRGDFYPKMPMFVVKDWKEYHNTNACYYNQGYWRKYNDTDPGYVVKIYNVYDGSAACIGTYALRSDIAGANDCSVEIPLTSGTQYFKVLGCDTTTINGISYAGTYYRDGGNGTMNTDNCTGWKLTDATGSNTGVLATASGDYKFTLTLGDGDLYISVDFPLAVGDYRLVYNGKMRTSYSEKKDHPSNYIRKLKQPTVNNDTTRTDIISFYVDPSTDNASLKPEIRFQYCSNIVGYTVTWLDFDDHQKIDLSGITKPGVYTFEIVQSNHKEGYGNHEITGRLIGSYEGNYYIRTDKAAGGWKSYKVSKDNQMVNTYISKQNSGYNYYYCNWIFANNNVKFTIANDYSECVTDTVENDDFVTNSGNLSADANVRFMYNDSSNFIGRAYINGSTYNNRYLVLTGDDNTFDIDGNTIPASGSLLANEMEFEDKGNWVYQEDLKAKSGSVVSVTAKYQNQVQNFITDQTLITSTDESTKYLLRVVYDFKTNQLIAAWLPDNAIAQDMDVTADVMLIRSGQGAANQITFSNNAKITGVKKMIGAIEFRKDSIVGRVGSFTGDVIGSSGNRTYREMMMYISFPFDVAVQDIFGIGQFNREWYLQYYDGAERAEKGFFRGDGTTTFWKFMNFSDTLRANVGYSLLLDNDYFNTNGQGVWKNIEDEGKVYLYFPSAKELDGKVIKSGTANITVPSHECKIDREFESAQAGGRTLNHKFTDSHWNMIGLPVFENQTGMETDKFVSPVNLDNVTNALETDHGYFYEWDSLSNVFSVHTTSGYTFKAMHGYMVQFTGSISFTGSSIQPSAIVAAHRAPQKEDYVIDLQLLFNGNRTGRTYVELREEADDAFMLNEDVYMIPTARAADIFTFAGNYDVAANVLPIGNKVVPVGVEVRKAGTYTFSMPSNFSGTVELVDTFNGERTNLAMGDYSVYLEKGYTDGRFVLEINVNKVPTAIDGINGEGTLKDGKAHKFLQNGIMYILRNGILYDAQGKRVQ